MNPPKLFVFAGTILPFALFSTTLPASEPVILTVQPTTIQVHGKEMEVTEIVQENGERGLTVEQEDGFHVLLRNRLPVPTSIHWHGLILPNLQDGVPYVTQNPIEPGEEREYQFPLVQHGTYWMHSHYGLQEQSLTTAPLIIMNAVERAKADRQFVIKLSDFTFRQPIEILRDLQKPQPMKMEDSKKPEMAQSKIKAKAESKRPSRVQKSDPETGSLTSELLEAPPVDIDVQYDALLANHKTASEAAVLEVAPGESVLLRIVAASSATNFFVDTGDLEAELLAVDGQEIHPLRGNFFQIAVAQRIDLRVVIPEDGGAFPILALGEGTKLQTGVVLATLGAEIPQLPDEAENFAGALDNTQELLLSAAEPLEKKAVDRELDSVLGGTMEGYKWTINGYRYPNRESLDVREGERVQMTIKNETMMSHPMHLHGHDFYVVEIDGKPLDGAKRDTVLVPPGGTTKIQFDADNPGVWAYHCHILYHLASGMFTVLKYDGADTTFWQPEKTPQELENVLP